MTKKAKYKEEEGYLSVSPLPSQISSTGNIITPPSWKNVRV
jgi:hypothetical protein